MVNTNTWDNRVLRSVINLIVREQLSSRQQKRPNLYRTVMHHIEPLLLETVLDYMNYNQSRAAKVLGLSRSTLRSKLDQHFGNKYFPQADEFDDMD